MLFSTPLLLFTAIAAGSAIPYGGTKSCHDPASFNKHGSEGLITCKYMALDPTDQSKSSNLYNLVVRSNPADLQQHEAHQQAYIHNDSTILRRMPSTRFPNPPLRKQSLGKQKKIYGTSPELQRVYHHVGQHHHSPHTTPPALPMPPNRPPVAQEGQQSLQKGLGKTETGSTEDGTVVVPKGTVFTPLGGQNIPETPAGSLAHTVSHPGSHLATVSAPSAEHAARLTTHQAGSAEDEWVFVPKNADVPSLGGHQAPETPGNSLASTLSHLGSNPATVSTKSAEPAASE
ncbi:hypothetical protein BC835DRAFT_1310510 [Cytidiella melzeri]|nr:hypothetical protein BC835DRAFT_1310510 [Cytidiella melzeri]